MSLYTDGPIITAATLTAIDPSVAAVSSAQTFPLTGPNGVIQLAWTELGHELLEWMQSLSGDIYASAGLIVQTGLFASNRARFLLNQVITTWQNAGVLSPLAQYAAHSALVLFWENAVRRSAQGDRFEKKWEMAQADQRKAKRRFLAAGIPIVLNPLSCPGAQFDPQAGTWSSLNVTVGPHPGTLAVETSYDLVATWVDQTSYVSPKSINNGESGPSQTISTILQPGYSLQANIETLFPPGSIPFQGGIADGVHYGRTASGWNVYAGVTGSALVLQNSSPLPLATTSYEMLTVATIGNMLLPGQVPDINQRPTRSFSRA